MDIRRVDAEPSSAERAAVDALLGPPRSAWDGGARGRAHDAHTTTVGGRDTRALRHLLLPALHALQARIGWISEGGLGYVCERLNVPPADAWGVATFYALLATEPQPRRVVHVCDDIACKARGADQVIAELEILEPTAPSASVTGRQPPHVGAWRRSACLGMCDRAPAAFVTIAGEQPREFSVGGVTTDVIRALIAESESRVSDAAIQSDDAAGDGAARSEYPANSTAARTDTGSTQPSAAQPVERAPVTTASDAAYPLLRRVGRVDPTSLDAYRASGGFAALAKARERGADWVIAEVTASNLVGRGGAAFPTGRKWQAVRGQAARPHYLVCNADESEPGTFKDRVLMESDPFAVIEGMAIAALAADCEKAFIYIRGEYPRAAARIRDAIDAARRAGVLGDLDVEIRRGAGAYICGEETALFESIEGYRGEPRNKPPFPVEAGLFGKPTVVNNVETLANVPHVVLGGGLAFAAVGTPQSAGTRLFCLSGNVRKPGLYEAALGTTLAALIDRAGGVEDGRAIAAVLLGGAAGTFLRGDELDLRLTHEDTRAAGTTLGSGVVMVFDDTIDLRAVVRRIAGFFRDESCGQCVPCRVGTIRQEESLHRLGDRGNGAEIALLADVGLAMKDASICGLGQTAYSAVESAITRLKLW